MSPLRCLNNPNSDFEDVFAGTGKDAANRPAWVDYTIPWGGDRGVYAGAYDSPASSDVMQYITILTTGDATDFGDQSETRNQMAGMSNGSRGVFAGGYPPLANVMDYITIASTGDATDFGDMHTGAYGVGGLSNTTRGIMGGGRNDSHNGINNIQYITIASTGAATDFGDLTYSAFNTMGVNNETRGIIAGGYETLSGGKVDINYFTIASAANAGDFGDLNTPRARNGSISGGTGRGVFAGAPIYGSPTPQEEIEYITIATTGNGTAAGDMLSRRTGMGSACNGIYGVFGGGGGSGSEVNTIEYMNVLSTGDTTDFGDLIADATYVAGCSGAPS